MSALRRSSLGEALRAARRPGGTPTPSPSNSTNTTPPPGPTRPRRIIAPTSLRSRPTALRPSPTPLQFFNDPTVLVSTPVEEGREDTYPEQLAYSFTYPSDLIAVLRAGGFNQKDGDCDFYHVVLNNILFTGLPVVIRGTALALYHEAARSHPGRGGRYVLQRLRCDGEGVPDSDPDRHWIKMRAVTLCEGKDPNPQLTVIPILGDKHARINTDYSEAKRVTEGPVLRPHHFCEVLAVCHPALPQRHP
ncbi:hypothetical protein CYMTET_20926 [Cymbomonas tetramitiformis]|uniref:Uncharacterized protein n=1 Tax=Cymbomonas tetramitiformis TaxID=36881 RepID=A0AAE0G325_9CHLO|nr:hypothetical protein CYMTET_20926 [Cymbomonas tetramitiformis]